jgi:hypothetical protein
MTKARDVMTAETVPEDGGVLGRAFTSLDAHFQDQERAAAPPPAEAQPEPEPETSAAGFQALVKGFKQEGVERAEEAREAAAERAKQEVGELVERHLTDEEWNDLLRRARDAAENGQVEFPMIRFPSQLCSDGGRAVNVAEPEWPETLRGEAAEIYQRYEAELKSQGFLLTARVLGFTDGMPGDIGLILTWGEAE